MKKRGLVLLILVMYVILFNGCAGGAYIKSSSEEIDIGIKDDAFDKTIDECIDILNQDLEKNDLDLISSEYMRLRHERWIIYQSKINDKLMVRFIKTDVDDDKVELIELISLESYENRQKDINYVATEAERDASIKYYEIICANVEPRFDTSQFAKASDTNNEFELDGLKFIFGRISLTEVYYDLEIRFYEVFSSVELYDEYNKTFFDDDSFFKLDYCQ